MIALFGVRDGKGYFRPLRPLNRIRKKTPRQIARNAGVPLGWSADDDHQAPVPTRSQAFFRENRELTWF